MRFFALKSKIRPLTFYKLEDSVEFCLVGNARGQAQLQQHIPKKTILDLAEDTVQLTVDDFGHFDRCTECFAHCAKSIVQVARKRAL